MSLSYVAPKSPKGSSKRRTAVFLLKSPLYKSQRNRFRVSDILCPCVIASVVVILVNGDWNVDLKKDLPMELPISSPNQAWKNRVCLKKFLFFFQFEKSFSQSLLSFYQTGHR